MALVSQPLGCDQNFRLIYFLKKEQEWKKKKYKNGSESYKKCLMMPNKIDCWSELMKTMKNYLIKLKTDILDNFTT